MTEQLIKRINDWNKIKYVFCADCKSSYQDPRIIYEYEENYWGEITDPDGNVRNLSSDISSIAAKVFQNNFRLFGPGHLCLFNPKSLEKILLKHKFKIIKREYPFWKTDYANFSNIIRMLMPWKISPAFYGSIMTFYAKKT